MSEGEALADLKIQERENKIGPLQGFKRNSHRSLTVFEPSDKRLRLDRERTLLFLPAQHCFCWETDFSPIPASWWTIPLSSPFHPAPPRSGIWLWLGHWTLYVGDLKLGGDPLEEKNVELCEERMPVGSHYPDPQDGPKPGRSALPSIL